MHGVKRSVAPSASAKEARKAKEAAKLKTYLEVEGRFLQVRKEGKLDQEALDATTHLLSINPELYTAWNYRRKIFSRIFLQISEPWQQKADFFAAARVGNNESASEPNDAATRTDSHEDRLARKNQIKEQLLLEDLELTQNALAVHPKVYWIWNHRKWCLINLPTDSLSADTSRDQKIENLEKKWRQEMNLVNKMLDMDSRNFHGWDYRRYLLSQIAAASISVDSPTNSGENGSQSTDVNDIPPFPYSLACSKLPLDVKRHHLILARAELAYTLRKIEANFSNFSAWHQRSKLLPNIWAGEDKEVAQLRSAREEEFNLLRQAIYTDPSDQSVWLYHAWLVDLDPSHDVLEREIESIEELLSIEPDSKWCIESLYRYKTLFAETLNTDVGVSGHRRFPCASDDGTVSAQKKHRLLCEAQQHLRRLIQVDQERSGRWRELSRRSEGDGS